jgi:hypothetical protein
MTWTVVKSLRFRITAVATVAIAIFLGLTAFFSVRYADNRLIDQVDRSLVNQVVYVRQQLQEHHILSATGPAGQFGQFFRANGTLIGSGTNIVGFPPLVHVTATGPSPRLFTVSNPRPGPADQPDRGRPARPHPAAHDRSSGPGRRPRRHRVDRCGASDESRRGDPESRG